MMTPRENLKSLLKRQGYETPPPFFFLCPHLEAVYRQQTGSDKPFEEYFGFANRQIGYVAGRAAENLEWSRFYPDRLAPGTRFSSYGVAHEPGGPESAHMTRMRHPLENADSLEQLQAYPWPDFSALDPSAVKRRAAEVVAAGLLPEAHMAFTIWEQSWYIRGMEQLMLDMVDDDPKAVFLLDTITDHACRRIEAYAMAGAEHIHVGDDVGTQHGLMMSEAMYREWLKPRLAKVIATAKAVNPEILVSYHSCGFVTPLIPDFIEAGVDVLNPVQPECGMDFAAIHAEFGDRLSFWGTIGTQSTLPFGTPDEVKRAVWRNLDIAGKKGGLWCTPTHILEPEVPWENILAYVDACREYGGAGV